MNRFKQIVPFLLLLIVYPSAVFADGATLYVSPATGSYTVGQLFPVRIMVATGGTSIHAAEATLQFDPASLAVESISAEGSIIGSWISGPTFSNATGTISFIGWTSVPFSGETGLLLTVQFKALRNAGVSARFAAGVVLATNGSSNIISAMQNAVFTIAPLPLAPTSSEAITIPLAPNTTFDYSTSTPGSMRSTSAVEPAFVENNQTIKLGNPIILRGAASPDAVLKVSIQEGEGSVMHVIISAAGDGSFTFVSDNIANPGVYRVWVAEMLGTTEGIPSAPILITVKDTAFMTEFALASSIAITVFPYAALVAAIAFGVAYLRHKQTLHQLETRGR